MSRSTLSVWWSDHIMDNSCNIHGRGMRQFVWYILHATTHIRAINEILYKSYKKFKNRFYTFSIDFINTMYSVETLCTFWTINVLWCKWIIKLKLTAIWWTRILSQAYRFFHDNLFTACYDFLLLLLKVLEISHITFYHSLCYLFLILLTIKNVPNSYF